ncbi:MAG: alpha/beta fold hydrolase [Gemmatimonadota bacterium]|nr:MAG: alpha/beta fold hydrolase [Gemmatimonadota bacterium]
MQTQRLNFAGATGATLSARLELPVDEQPIAFALFAHCFTCSKNFKAAVNIARALARAQIAVLRFDFTGLGESEGDFAETTFSSNVDDLVAAARFLESEWQTPAILIGHSLGGAAVLQAAHRLPSAKAVATIAAPAEPAHVTKHLRSSLEEIRKCGAAEVLLAGRPFTIRKEFLDDLDQQNMAETIRKLGRPLFVFHSPSDTIVGPENGARIFELASEPKSYISLDGADHLLSRSEDSEYVGAVIAAWATRFLAVPLDIEAQKVSRGGVVVRTGRRRYHTEILAGGHTVVADEPEQVGGANTGPTPFELLQAALGACTTITLRMYADRKEWPLEEIAVRLRHRKLKPAEAPAHDQGQPRLEEITQTLDLSGPLDDEQRARLFEIAHRCPVHRALEAGVNTRMELADESGQGGK